MNIRDIELETIINLLNAKGFSTLAKIRIFKGFQDYLSQCMENSTNIPFDDARRIGNEIVCVMNERMVCLELNDGYISISSKADILLEHIKDYIFNLAKECELKTILAPLILDQIEENPTRLKENAIPPSATLELIKRYVEA
jgi:hypothetical protein